jgi:hypothetical protein
MTPKKRRPKPGDQQPSRVTPRRYGDTWVEVGIDLPNKTRLVQLEDLRPLVKLIKHHGLDCLFSEDPVVLAEVRLGNRLIGPVPTVNDEMVAYCARHNATPTEEMEWLLPHDRYTADWKPRPSQPSRPPAWLTANVPEDDGEPGPDSESGAEVPEGDDND